MAHLKKRSTFGYVMQVDKDVVRPYIKHQPISLTIILKFKIRNFTAFAITLKHVETYTHTHTAAT